LFPCSRDRHLLLSFPTRRSSDLPLSSPIRLQSSRLVQVLLRAAYLNPVAKPPHGWRLCCLHFPAVPCSPKFPLSSVVVTYLSLLFIGAKIQIESALMNSKRKF